MISKPFTRNFVPSLSQYNSTSNIKCPANPGSLPACLPCYWREIRYKLNEPTLRVSGHRPAVKNKGESC